MFKRSFEEQRERVCLSSCVLVRRFHVSHYATEETARIVVDLTPFEMNIDEMLAFAS